MGKSVAAQLIEQHLVEGSMRPGEELGLRIDQTLTQDATGTLVMLELEAMELDRVKTELSVQYVDHNLLQEDHKNSEDHLFLESACRRFGIWFSRPGNGVSHPVHQERFGKPGKTLLGSDSHTCAAGAIGMLAVGAGGLEVAMAMAGFPFYVKMPEIWGVRLVNELPDWVSAKDIILEMLRRYSVKGGVGRIVEYYGPGLRSLSAMDRHVIANMGAELGATTTVFPSDHEVRRFLKQQQREQDWKEIVAEENAHYDVHDELDLSKVEPLIAKPSSPDNVVPVRTLEEEPIYQAYIGSSANPGYRDFAVAAEMVRGRQVAAGVSLDINPTSRQILANLVRDGHLLALIQAGARVHQAGCNGCIGMGQAPAQGRISLRTVPRNFPGRSGTHDDLVYLVSPETAAASALMGKITDPRTLSTGYPRITDPEQPIINTEMLTPPLGLREARVIKLEKGNNIESLPEFPALDEQFEVPVILKVGDNISTDEILPAGSRVLPFRSNIPKISEFCFAGVDAGYSQRAAKTRDNGGHAILAGTNYGQGSSREHAALGPRYFGLRLVIAKSFARIHWQNLINFGVLPLELSDEGAYEQIASGDRLKVANLHERLQQGKEVSVTNLNREVTLVARHRLSRRQVEVLLAGGLVNWVKMQRAGRHGGKAERAAAARARATR